MSIFTQYRRRIKNILTFRSRKWYYCLFKAVCAVAGLPLYTALIPLDFLLGVIYALFSAVPFLRELFFVVCKCLGYVCAAGYYFGIAPDARHYIAEAKAQAAVERAAIIGDNDDVGEVSEVVSETVPTENIVSFPGNKE